MPRIGISARIGESMRGHSRAFTSCNSSELRRGHASDTIGSTVDTPRPIRAARSSNRLRILQSLGENLRRPLTFGLRWARLCRVHQRLA